MEEILSSRQKKEKTMRKTIIALLFAFVLVLGLHTAEGTAQMGSGYGMGPGMMGQGGYYPYGGQHMGPGYGMGPGMMGPGYGMGPGMMGPGYGMGPGMMGPGYGMGYQTMHPGWGMGPGMMGPGYGYSPQYGQSQKPLDEKGAQEISENYLQSVRNPNLKLGKIKDTGSVFEVEIVTKKSGDLVNKIAIDKNTGWMSPVY